MDERHAAWMEDRERLKQALSNPAERDLAVEIFMRQHAMVHAARMSGMGLYSFEDEALQGLPEAAYRTLPAGVEHTVAWVVWHITRCEDITMNLLVEGCPQVLEDGWAAKIGAPALDTGNTMDAAAAQAFSAPLSVSALLDYRTAVGRRTREIVARLQGADFGRKMDPQRLRLVAEKGAVLPGAAWLIDYWGGRTVAGLLLMPATRHHISHLNEILRLRKKLKQ